MRIERNEILAQIKKKNPKNKPAGSRVIKQLNKQIWHVIKHEIEDFATAHGEKLNDISFQCDSDCRNFIKDINLKPKEKGRAYVLSDIVAWFNSHNKEPRGVIVRDPRKSILKQLQKEFR